jgi:hypothetical protein
LSSGGKNLGKLLLWKQGGLKMKILTSRMTVILRGASGRTHPLFKWIFSHPCHNDPNLTSESTLKFLGPIDKNSVTARKNRYITCQNKEEQFS